MENCWEAFRDLKIEIEYKKILREKRDKWVLKNFNTCKYCKYLATERGFELCFVSPEKAERNSVDIKCRFFTIEEKYILNIVEFEKILSDEKKGR